MDDIADPRSLDAALRRHGARAAKSLGQHFLVDRGVLASIVDAAELSANDDVLEIGPGPGVLTAALADHSRSVTTIEIDERMIAMLRETLGERDNVRIVRADALAVDLYVQAERRPTRIVANLPYQITTPLLERFIGDARRPPLVVVLVQEEVARRIVATAANERAPRERGYLSVFVESFAEARIVRRVPPRAFRPPPRVSSAVVALRTRERPAFAPLDERAFLRFVSDVFRHRRKQLRSALGHEAGIDRERAERALQETGIDPRRRAEELSVAQWVALATALGVPRE
ncbi:MAG: ribosomal RNA small subunit methyltransferase A [Chloroflexi bacterium]|nr:MAG: ribosomal RNA small subunit methyltransferase A [Chloroflexota bacterium]TMC35502.1 MAG: ribosomal RNA small subunit methyltransferase A [Chloroflexota bacterium]TMC57882.1 MAG: ribosomal RNA small subunit methyltransferase A [Chloroflexota bacterium]TME41416.1 MAG: ribosomal RNA small subunit methyltransferase A [Chloroflexota bacterium]